MGQDVFMILKNAASRPTITVQDVRDWASTTIENIRNDESGWSENGRQISEAGKDVPAENPSIAVLIDFAQTITSSVVVEGAGAQVADDQPNEHSPAKQQVAPTDLALNLQYFFPYCDQAFFNNPDVRVILVVICANKQDEQRVKCYLSAISLEKPRLCICTTVTEPPSSISDLRLNSIQPAAITYGALLPLVCVGQGPPPDSNNKQFSLTSVLLGTPSDSFYRYIDFKQKRPDLQNVQLAQFLEAGYHIIDDINKYFTSSAKTPDILAMLEKNRAALWNAVHRDSAKSQIKRLPLITQLIWLYSIRFMLYQDLQWDRNGISGFLSHMELLLWDSIAYGEGILQLLENSELHSQHHCGYLSIYFHRVALTRISEIAAAADRRIQIYHKYRYNPRDSFTSSLENIYLEFNIIDMCRDYYKNTIQLPRHLHSNTILRHYVKPQHFCALA
jgi:hypothetical protein